MTFWNVLTHSESLTTNRLVVLISVQGAQGSACSIFAVACPELPSSFLPMGGSGRSLEVWTWEKGFASWSGFCWHFPAAKEQPTLHHLMALLAPVAMGTITYSPVAPQAAPVWAWLVLYFWFQHWSRQTPSPGSWDLVAHSLQISFSQRDCCWPYRDIWV